MVESISDTTEDGKVSTKEANIGANDESMSADPRPDYPYHQILQQLQSKAIRAQDPAAGDEDEEKVESHDNASQRTPWDLTADALLATLLHEFSRHVASRTHSAAAEIRDLQNSVNGAGVDVAICQTEFMRRSADIFMEQVVGDDESESDSEGNVDDGDAKVKKLAKPTEEEKNDRDLDDDDDSSADIARLEAEERSAIADGMMALKLFFDPKRPSKSSSGSGSSGEGDAVVDVEEDVIGENCYYYPSAEEDGFNQRPLPFIVGSREFMESSCAGLGGDGGEHSSEEE